MGGFPEFDRYDAMGLAELVRQGQVTPMELCEEAIKRIERVNPKLNAVVTRMYDHGLKEASGPLPEGPLYRSPLAHQRPASRILRSVYDIRMQGPQ